MEEKKYPHIDEEQGIDMACEPVAEVAAPSASSVNGVTVVHDWIDDLDWDRFPILGPKTAEEAIARIDKFEEELAKDEVKWIRIDDIHAELKKLHPWL
jgi:hypothetical protein